MECWTGNGSVCSLIGQFGFLELLIKVGKSTRKNCTSLTVVETGHSLIVPFPYILA